MNRLFEKNKEVTQTLLPVVIFVLLLCFTVLQVEKDVILRFLVGSAMLLIGLSTFLWGVDLAINPIGEHMSWEAATSKTPFKIAILGFLLGLLITIAEPNLLVLGSQVEAASGGTLHAWVIVYLVSIGVGLMIALGFFRLLRGRPLNVFMAITYGIIFVLALFISEEFLAISFDASGAATGILAAPFVLALSLGLSRAKGGRQAEENAFGLVGIMGAGPILAVIAMSILSGQKNIKGEIGEFVAAKGVFGPILHALPGIFLDSLIALLPLTILFFLYNYAKFKLPKGELSRILKGLAMILFGLVIFLVAVQSGFMDMGRIIGMEIAGMNHWLLVGIGFLLGLIVVLVEPAVHVLVEQIQEVTGGHIPLNLIRITLSLGVAAAVALSMVRIVVPSVHLWYFLLPGFAIAILLSFRVDPVFVGIAYDAGTAASGPLTATFLLAFAQGAAAVVDSANVLVDGFGVIAMVAMAPIFSVMILGTAFKHKKITYAAAEEEEDMEPSVQEEDNVQHDCILAVVNRGFADRVVEVARQSGATGSTIMHGRGTGGHKVLLPIINIELYPEKEIILLVTGTQVSGRIADKLLQDPQLAKEGEAVVFISPAVAMAESLTADSNPPAAFPESDQKSVKT